MVSGRTTMGSENIRVSAHAQRLKIGRKADGTKPTLSHQLKDQSLAALAQAKHLRHVGFKLTAAQEKALHAVQVLLDDTGYEGNRPPVKAQRRQYRLERTLPVLRVKSSEFLKQYGVRKLKTTKGCVFSPGARRVAMNALRDLRTDLHVIIYEKTLPGRKQKVRVEDVAPLLHLRFLNGGRTIEITPNPVLVDQIDTYFALRPRDFYEHLSTLSPTEARFVSMIYSEMEVHRRIAHGKGGSSWTIRLTVETLAKKLRVDSLLRSRKKAVLRKKLVNLYDKGVKAGLLEWYTLDQPATKGRVVDVLKLNPNALKDIVPDGADSSTDESEV